MYLDRIVDTKREEVAELKRTFSKAGALERIAALPSTRGFAETLSARRKRSMGLIAEVKKASPSKGLIRPDFDPVAIALAYEAAGADCLSVLTDAHYFQGSGEYLRKVREAVNLPLLRKDFIIDETQIYEARLLGADAVLLIAAILEPRVIQHYMSVASSIGLDCLIEVHDRQELEAVLKLEGVKIVGVNNRNLRTFETALSTTSELGRFVPEGITFISESGISAPEDISYLASAGAHGVLVGEHFMRERDVARAVIDLMGPAFADRANDKGAVLG